MDLKYFDIPKLHEFGPEGMRFFELLETTDNYSLFEKKSIQILIMFKWQKVHWFIKYFQFGPHLFMIITYMTWLVFVRGVRSEYLWFNRSFVGLLILQVLYFSAIEIV